MQANRFYIDIAIQQEMLFETAQANLQRFQPFAAVIIGIESVLLILLLVYSQVSASFKYSWYAFMYLLMIIITGLTWIFFSRLRHKLDHGLPEIKMLDLAIIIYLCFLMTWGAVISLIDQDLYGNIAAFLINLLAGSFMFYVNPKRIMIPLFLSGLVLFIGLPVFQPSRDVLVGHYTNATIFIVLSWLVARTNYQAFVENYTNRKTIKGKSQELIQINEDLLKEIASREQIQLDLEAANQQLAAISSLDALTGIPNRRRLDEVLRDKWDKAVIGHIPVAIIMIDIDLFKLYNDSYGHLEGDYCLRQVARVINEFRRGEQDLVARYGGEEFVFVAVDIDKNDALRLADKIRSGIESLCLQHSRSFIGPYLTASLGISWQIPQSIDSLTECINRADRAMYQAKNEGRNRVIMAE